MSVEIVNNLTDLGYKYFFEKLFNPSVSYNQMFYSNASTLLKLRLYRPNTSYIESSSEIIEISDDGIKITYKFNILPSNGITVSSIKLVDTSGNIIMEINSLDITRLIQNGNYNELNEIILKFSLEQVTLCIPNDSKQLIYKSLTNQNNYKLDTIYLGTGEPVLDGSSSVLTNLRYSLLVSDYKIKGKELSISEDVTAAQDITEVGLGYSINDEDYICYFLQSANLQLSTASSIGSMIYYKLVMS